MPQQNNALNLFYFVLLTLLMLLASCGSDNEQSSIGKEKRMKADTLTAADILGNPAYQAMSYGGYRAKSRDVQPTLDQLKDDMRLLHAMGIRIIRTYNVQLPQASNILAAIRALKATDPNFEMYVMLGAWIDCKNAWTDQPVDHERESEKNSGEIARAIALAKEYPDIVKIIAVGNEAMVKWATSYFVQPRVILKWVNLLQGLKKEGELPADLWITSSDNFASWGGGAPEYHVEDLNKLIHAVDFLSVHTYPMHDTHYNPVFWGSTSEEAQLTKKAQIDKVMDRASNYADLQYQAVADYVKMIGADKPIHIGETGWASGSNGFYGNPGSQACDEYKEGIYYKHMQAWSKENNISCFYFEAFDEPWKDAANPGGSENHFGLFTVDGKAKYALWPLVDQGVFEGLTRDGNSITKTSDGDEARLLELVQLPPANADLAH